MGDPAHTYHSLSARESEKEKRAVALADERKRDREREEKGHAEGSGGKDDLPVFCDAPPLLPLPSPWSFFQPFFQIIAALVLPLLRCDWCRWLW